jgi:hypothetical protein
MGGTLKAVIAPDVKFCIRQELADIYSQQLLLHGSYEIHITEMTTKIADWLDAGPSKEHTFAVTWSPNGLTYQKVTLPW